MRAVESRGVCFSFGSSFGGCGLGCVVVPDAAARGVLQTVEVEEGCGAIGCGLDTEFAGRQEGGVVCDGWRPGCQAMVEGRGSELNRGGLGGGVEEARYGGWSFDV